MKVIVDYKYKLPRVIIEKIVHCNCSRREKTKLIIYIEKKLFEREWKNLRGKDK